MRELTFCLTLLPILSSCDTEESRSEISVDYIEFTVSTEVDRTRGDLVESYLDIDNIGVFAASGSREISIIYNLEVTRKLREWRYDYPLEWADYNDSATHFLAYSPYGTSKNGVAVEYSEGSLTLEYTAPTLASEHPYIMVSYPVLKEAEDVSQVRFTMQHPMCAVGFSTESFSLSHITLSGVGTQATLVVNSFGEFVWRSIDSYGDVILEAGEYAMFPPQILESAATVCVVFDEIESKFSLSSEEWGVNERVDYIVAADSLYRSTQHRELIL